MKVLTVIGARPQFIKAAMISRKLSELEGIEEAIIHTGQHFDQNMSELFFEELEIPEPKANLSVSGGTHAQMTAKMLVALESAMVAEEADAVLLYGDTNSTLAGALAAAKLDIPICHAEAGARTGFLSSPEEVNRICTDHLALANCAPTPSCLNNLVDEGLGFSSSFTGDLMYDAFLHYSWQTQNDPSPILHTLDGIALVLPEPFCYLTCHRQENTSESDLTEILFACQELGMPVVYPVHPRMRELAKRVNGAIGANKVFLVEPVGYLESVQLTNRAQLVITDSGGLQREAFFAKKKCVTLLPFPSTPELLAGARNTLVPEIERNEIVRAAKEPQKTDDDSCHFGNGDAASAIIDRLLDLGKETAL